MIGVLLSIVVVGFISTLVLNSSSSSELKETISNYIKSADKYYALQKRCATVTEEVKKETDADKKAALENESQTIAKESQKVLDEYLDAVVRKDDDVYYYDGAGGPDAAQGRDKAVEGAKSDAMSFFNFLNENEIKENGFDVVSIGAYNCLAALVRFPVKHEVVLKNLRCTIFESVKEQLRAFGLPEESLDNLTAEHLPGEWTLENLKAFHAYAVELVKKVRKDPENELKYLSRLIQYVENPAKYNLRDEEYIMFVTTEDCYGKLRWVPNYYSGGAKVINPVNFLFDKSIADIPRYSSISRFTSDYTKQIADDRLWDTREQIMVNNFQGSLNGILSKINSAKRTKEDFIAFGLPDFLNGDEFKTDVENQKAFLEKMWDRYRPYIVPDPDNALDSAAPASDNSSDTGGAKQAAKPSRKINPRNIKAAASNAVRSSLTLYREFGLKTINDPVGVVMKVKVEASRFLQVELSKSMQKENVNERTFMEIVHVTLVRFLNPATKEYRWLPVAITDDYDENLLRNAIKRELERRKILETKKPEPIPQPEEKK
jgi:hypothetical protein